MHQNCPLDPASEQGTINIVKHKVHKVNALTTALHSTHSTLHKLDMTHCTEYTAGCCTLSHLSFEKLLHLSGQSANFSFSKVSLPNFPSPPSFFNLCFLILPLQMINLSLYIFQNSAFHLRTLVAKLQNFYWDEL